MRHLIPGTIDVLVSRPADAEQASTGPSRIGRTPHDLFAEYLEHRRIEDPRLLRLFDELVAEVHEPDRVDGTAGLEMEGFSAFAERTVVDFEGAELFALTGPTGAGKTSVFDVIPLRSLRGGSPPRKQAVTAVVTQGRLEARLDFTVADTGHRLARVVRRDPRTGKGRPPRQGWKPGMR